MKIVAAYIRVSTDEQTEYSPDSQLKEIRKYAEKHDMLLYDEFIFIEEGISGKAAKNRPEFNRMIGTAKLKPKPFDAVLLWKFSRFARNQEEAIVYKNVLKKMDIDVISISEPIIDGVFGSLIERIIEWMDEYYLINLSDEVKRGMQERFSRGEFVSTPPLGYTAENGKLIPSEDAQTVQNIFKDFADGMGYRQLATKYSSLGVRTKRGNPIDNRAIEYMLRNPIYIGKLRISPSQAIGRKRDVDADDIIITDGIHTPIIDIHLWEKVQERVKSIKAMYPKYQRREQTTDFTLKGLIRCSSCGATLVQAVYHKSLQCHNYARGSCHISHSVSMQKANEIILASMKEALAQRSFAIVDRDKTPENPERLSDIKKLITYNQGKLNRAREAYLSGIDTAEEYNQTKKEITVILLKLEAEQKKLFTSKPFDADAYAQKLTEVISVFESDLPADLKNTALRSVIDHITYNSTTHNFEIYYYA